MKSVNSGINMEKDTKIHLENKKESRIFFWFIWLLYAIVYMTKNAYNGALASIVDEGILTKSQTGFITGMFYLVYAPFQVVGGIAADRYSPERMIKIGLIGGAVANIIIFFNQNYYVMLFTWIFNGIIQFGIWPSIFKIITSQLVRSDRSKMMFYITFSSSVGLILSYLLAAAMPTWEYNFASSAVFLLVFAAGLHIFEKHLNPLMKWDKDEKDESIQKIEIKKELTKIPTMKVFIAGGFAFMFITTILATITSQSRSNLTSVMFVENYEFVSPALGNVLSALLIGMGILGTVFAGKISQKVKNEPFAVALIYLALTPVYAVTLLVGKVPIYLIAAALCVASMLESGAGLFRNYYSMEYTKYGKSGTAAGIMNAGSAVSFMLAAYVVPLLAEKFGWSAVTIMWPSMVIISALLLFIIVKRYKKFKNGDIG